MSEKRERRKAVVRGVPLDGKEWDFWFAPGGVVVHRKRARRGSSLLVPFRNVATGAGLEVEAGGRVFRAALTKAGLAFCEVKARARAKVLPWRKVAWLLDMADESAVQEQLFKGIV